MRTSEATRSPVVVVTGAASGIGRELVRQWGRAGARVALLDIDRAGMQELALELGVESIPTLVVECNVRELSACRQAVGEVVDRGGGIDVLVNNAGISHHSELRYTEVQVLRRVMEVNFFGAMQLTHAALPHLIRSRGRIVAVSSVAGFAPLVGRTGYAASKHALHGFFDTLRAELRSEGVTVTLACPSYTETSIDDNAISADGAEPLAKKTTGKLLRAQDVARAIIAASEERKDRVLISPIAKASYWLSRLLPATYERAMRRSQR